MLAPETRVALEESRPPLSALFRQIADDATMLARAEVKLARAEVADNAGKLARPAAMLCAAALLGVAAIFTLMGAFVGWLAPYVGAGWAALIVAAAVGLVALLLAKAGIGGIGAVSMTPERSIRSVRADVNAAKDAVA